MKYTSLFRKMPVGFILIMNYEHGYTAEFHGRSMYRSW